MNTITIRDEFIKLGQALKLAGLVDSGVEAKIVIQDGLVKVNGVVDYAEALVGEKYAYVIGWFMAVICALPRKFVRYLRL